MTVAWVSETSGNASIGRRTNAVTPSPMNNSAMSATNKGWRSANPTTRWIMERARPGSIEQLFQEDAALRHHALPGPHPGRDHHRVVLGVVHLDLAANERARLLLDEHVVVVALQEHGRRRHAHVRRRLGRRLDA